MRVFLAVALTTAALVLSPAADRAFGSGGVHPNLCLAPLAIAVISCPGVAAVVLCGLVGLIVDCLSGPQFGARAACFALLAALGSNVVDDRAPGPLRRLALVWAILFTGEWCSQAIQCAETGVGAPPTEVLAATLATSIATTVLIAAVWLGARLILNSPKSIRTVRRVALAVGRAGLGD